MHEDVVRVVPARRTRPMRRGIVLPVPDLPDGPELDPVRSTVLRRLLRRPNGRNRPGHPGHPGPSVLPFPFTTRYRMNARGLWRAFAPAVYRFYRSNSGPPAESDSFFDSNATLPHTPADTFAEGTWWVSVSYYNGVIDSGFLPIGPNGETYIRFDVEATTEKTIPPITPVSTDLSAPGIWQLEVRAGGVVRVHGTYRELGAVRANYWWICWTNDGSTPISPGGTPPPPQPSPIQVAMVGTDLDVLEYDLPAQSNGTTVKLRLHVRRYNPPDEDVFSEGSEVLTATADAVGPTAPPGGDRWTGRTPQEL